MGSYLMCTYRSSTTCLPIQPQDPALGQRYTQLKHHYQEILLLKWQPGCIPAAVRSLSAPFGCRGWSELAFGLLMRGPRGRRQHARADVTQRPAP
eukprot:75700-Chlamydomonas_euryale.AAC.4